MTCCLQLQTSYNTKFHARAVFHKGVTIFVSWFLPLVGLSLFFSLAATRSLSSSSLLKSRLRTSSGASWVVCLKQQMRKKPEVWQSASGGNFFTEASKSWGEQVRTGNKNWVPCKRMFILSSAEPSCVHCTHRAATPHACAPSGASWMDEKTHLQFLQNSMAVCLQSLCWNILLFSSPIPVSQHTSTSIMVTFRHCFTTQSCCYKRDL